MFRTTGAKTTHKPATNALEDSDPLVCSSEESSDVPGPKAPRMISGGNARSHVFHEVPDDVRRYFVARFLHGETPLETVAIRGLYARISKAHHAEMTADRQLPENAWMSSVRSAALIPALARRAKHAKHAQTQLAADIDVLAKTHGHVVLPLSALDSKSAQVTVLYRALVASEPKEIVIDYAGPANFWKKKIPACMPLYSSLGSWRHLKKLLKLMQSIPRVDKRELRIDLLLCNRAVEPAVLETLLKAGDKVLRTVRKLDLSGLVISRLEDEYAFSLEYAARSVAKTLQQLPALQEFRLCDSVIDSGMLQLLCTGLNSHPTMRVLALGGNLLCHIFGADRRNLVGWTALMAEITGMRALRELDLSHNLVDDEAATILLAALRLNKRLEKVDLRGNLIGKDHPIWLDERVIGD